MISKSVECKINFLSKINKLSIKEYCNLYAKEFGVNVLSKEEINHIVEENLNNDFFPEVLNMKKNFENGNLEFLLNYFLLFEEINNNFIRLYRDVENEVLFNHKNLYKNNTLLFKIIDCKMDILLSLDEQENIDSFLFLNFLPIFQKNELLYDIKTKIPLICLPNITMSNFNLLIYLMKNYDSNNFEVFKLNKNLNHFILELFFSEAIAKININFKDQKSLVKEKLQILFGHEITIRNIEKYLPKHVSYSFEKEIKEFKNYESIYFANKLDGELKKKEQKSGFLKV